MTSKTQQGGKPRMSNPSTPGKRSQTTAPAGTAGTARKAHPTKPQARAHTMINGVDVDCANAYCHGQDAYPHKNGCPRDYQKDLALHDAWWSGWWDAATAADRQNGAF